MNQRKIADAPDLGPPLAAKEIIEVASMALRWGAVLVGGLSLLMYTKEIHRFPAGIGLGEGLAFYLVSAAFVIYYAIYWIIVSAIGCVMMRWPMEVVLILDQKRKRHVRAPAGIPPNTTLSSMMGMEVCVVAAIGSVFYALLVHRSGASWSSALTVPAIQGTAVALWIILSRRRAFDEVGLVLPSIDPRKGDERRQLPFAKRIVALMLAVMPWLFMPNSSHAVHSAFATAQLRKEKTALHVQKPWSELLLKGVTGKASPLGQNYVKIPCVNVLLYGIGDVVIIDRGSMREPADGRPCESTSQKESQEPVALPANRVWVE